MMFWDNVSVSSSRVKKFKRESTAQLKLTDTIFFFVLDFVHHLVFLRSTTFWKPAMFPFNQAKKHLTWWTA
jgi:hypothetical protein